MILHDAVYDAYVMHRTSLLIDDETKRAARQLASKYDCSTSEAIRRAVVKQRDAVFGLSSQQVADRRAALDKLIELFDGIDVEAEIRRMKEEDEWA